MFSRGFAFRVLFTLAVARLRRAAPAYYAHTKGRVLCGWSWVAEFGLLNVKVFENSVERSGCGFVGAARQAGTGFSSLGTAVD